MKENYRIINRGQDSINIHWIDTACPTEDDISRVAETVASEVLRDSFNKRNHDTLLIQQKRRLGLLGWRTLTSVNLFDIDLVNLKNVSFVSFLSIKWFVNRKRSQEIYY